VRRKIALAVLGGVVVLAFLGFAASEFVGRVSHLTASPAANVNAKAPAPARTAATPGTPGPARTAGKQSPSSGPAPSAVPPQALVPVSAAAFGPDGTADGDNPQLASEVLTDPAGGWNSDWYTTAQFGDLKTGTGLLLDMGRPVMITAVQVTLGTQSGANLQLRGGAAVSDLTAFAAATDAGGSVDLAPSQPVLTRYVLLWFTRLPPDDVGTYQVAVHGITILGKP
jgi:hypothetical protein